MHLNLRKAQLTVIDPMTFVYVQHKIRILEYWEERLIKRISKEKRKLSKAMSIRSQLTGKARNKHRKRALEKHVFVSANPGAWPE